MNMENVAKDLYRTKDLSETAVILCSGAKLLRLEREQNFYSASANTVKHAWLDQELQQEIRKVFGPRYKKRLSDDEVILIAENLTDFMEGFLKMKWREGKYGTNTAK